MGSSARSFKRLKILINNNQPTKAAHMAYLAELYSAAGHATRIEARDMLRVRPSAAPLFFKEVAVLAGELEERVAA